MSSETKWTRGEWKVAPRGCEGFAVVQVDGAQNVALFMSEADAQLLVAAKSMYEALVLLEAELIASGNAKATDYGWPVAIEKARTALASARGEG